VSNVAEIKQQASALRKQRNYEEAVALYGTLWEENRDQCNEWDGWGYAFSLRKLGRSQQALEVCQEALPLNPNLDHLTSLCGWCLYDVEIRRTDAEIQQNEGRFLQAAEEILQLGKPGKFSAHARTLMRVIDYYRQKLTTPASKILEWCDRIQPEQLSNEPGHGPDGKGRTVEYASDREKWYSCRCKALFDLGRYEECIELAGQALAAFPKLHHDNDVWFKWRIALSKAELGDREIAISELEALLSRKRDWFVHHKIAQYLLDLGRTGEALNRAVAAALGPGPSDLGFKWELYLLMGRIFQARGEMDQARAHVLLAAKVRQEEDWKIPPELSQAIGEMDVDMASQISAQDLHRQLRRDWQALKVSDMPAGQGEIKNLLSHGKAGFIRGDDGKDYYFKTSSFRGPRHLLEPGQRVSFHVERNPDPGKRDIAVFVRPEGSI
jgi:tetratricopeptide (TPR) repeat protein